MFPAIRPPFYCLAESPQCTTIMLDVQWYRILCFPITQTRTNRGKPNYSYSLNVTVGNILCAFIHLVYSGKKHSIGKNWLFDITTGSLDSKSVALFQIKVKVTQNNTAADIYGKPEGPNLHISLLNCRKSWTENFYVNFPYQNYSPHCFCWQQKNAVEKFVNLTLQA